MVFDSDKGLLYCNIQTGRGAHPVSCGTAIKDNLTIFQRPWRQFQHSPIYGQKNNVQFKIYSQSVWLFHCVRPKAVSFNESSCLLLKHSHCTCFYSFHPEILSHKAKGLVQWFTVSALVTNSICINRILQIQYIRNATDSADFTH
jgi:hypothetical protein